MQNCCKFILRQLRIVNNNVINRTFNHICVFRREVIRNEISNSDNFIKCIYFNTQNVSVTSKLKQNLVSNINDLEQYIKDGKQFYLKLLTNILDTIDFENISSADARLLLECCGNSVADSTQQARNNVCQDIYKNLVKYNKLDLNVCHTYITVCTDNSIAINSKEFLSSAKIVPNKETYKLLLNNVCEKGNIEQALQLLEVMKNKAISADEDVFNDLVLVHTIRGGIKSGESVLLTMKAAQVPETANTKFSILKGVSKRDSFDEFQNVLRKYPISLTDIQLLELVKVLGINDNISWLPKIRNLYSNIITREFINVLEQICIHLVHMDKSEYAMTVYEEFVEPSSDQNYGFFLLREMLHCNVDIDRIISLAKHLQEVNLNKNALRNLTEIALKHKYIESSWRLLENMAEVRPHYFWPLLLNAYEIDGEAGIFRVLKKMVNMDVKVDSETLQFYILPFCNLDNTKLLIKKLQDLLGLTVKEIHNSVLLVLLENNQAKLAADLCNNFDVRIFGDKLFRLLSSTWNTSKDAVSIVLLLQRYCESNQTDYEYDLVGDFLTKTLRACKTSNDFIQYLKLLDLIREKSLRINTTSAEVLNKLCSTTCNDADVTEKIRDHIDALSDFQLKPKPELARIPHPRDMNINELECHLLELQEKNMETRGILRKLILLYASIGNLQRVEELRTQFLNAGYNETYGIKSSLMHSYVKGGHLDSALNIYKEIKDTSPHFKLDDFKIIDLATLLIMENKFNEAMDIMKKETESKKVRGGPAIVKNCWQLLGSFKNEDEQLQMFNFLVDNFYCKPSNIILGPLVRIHLNRDLQKAVDIYINCTNKYKCTPLQLEVICAILKSEDEVLLQKVLKATEHVHGPVPTYTVLIAALAENGQEKPLKKLFASNKMYIKKELQKRCERWVQEGKVNALQTLANACQRLPKEVFDVNFIYSCILQIYSFNDDCKGAIEFYEQLTEKDAGIDKEIGIQLNNLLKRRKFEVKNVNI